MSQIIVEHFHGKVARVPIADTACTLRVSGFNVAIIAQWTQPSETERHIAWARQTYTALSPYFAGTRYVNYLEDDEPGDPAAVVYGPNYAKLRDLKTKYDPDNFFRANVNIRPR
ncbi:MAG: BBE domain-containing protein [Acidobacteria bacterium]|nr:BBE domain-containing protein [Acidobacteriota bacterium]